MLLTRIICKGNKVKENLMDAMVKRSQEHA